MQQLVFIVLPFFMFLYSCNSNEASKTHYSLKDSVLKEHLLVLDSLPYYDTSDINYKVLKAYQNNDSNSLKELHAYIKRDKLYELQTKSEDSCIRQQHVQDLNADEVYRFIYSAAFCPYKMNITITKKNDCVNLNYILYQFARDAVSCKIINVLDKRLTSNEWLSISESLYKADIWGLKRENGLQGIDGSDIVFIGYRKSYSLNEPNKFTFIHRWGPSTLKAPLDTILRISGNQQGCYWITADK